MRLFLHSPVSFLVKNIFLKNKKFIQTKTDLGRRNSNKIYLKSFKYAETKLIKCTVYLSLRNTCFTLSLSSLMHFLISFTCCTCNMACSLSKGFRRGVKLSKTPRGKKANTFIIQIKHF